MLTLAKRMLTVATARRVFRAVAFSGIAAWLMAALPARAAEPAVVVSVKSFQELLLDSQYLGNALSQPLLGAALPGVVAQLTGGKGLKGLDASKPIGLYLTVTPDGQPKDAVVFVPVTAQKTFSDTLSALFPNPSTENGITEYQPPNAPNPIFAKPGTKHFVFAQSADALQEIVDLDKLVKSTADIAIELDLTKLSDGLKEQFLARADAAAEAQSQANRSASDAERRGEEAGRKLGSAALRRLAMDGDRLSIGLNVDAKARHISLDLGFTARPQTALAAACDGFGKTESPFSGLVSNQTAASFLLSSPLSQDAQGVFALILQEGEKAGLAAIQKEAQGTESDRAAAKRVVKQLVESVQQVVNRGRLDTAVIVNAGEAGTIRILSAMKVVKGRELGDIFEKVVNDGPAKSGQVKLRVAETKAARIHAITLPDDGDTQKHFGSNTAHLAFADDVILLTFGGDSLATAKSVLEAKPEKTTRAPISLRLSLSKLLPLAKDADPKILELGKSALESGRDEIALEVASQPHGAKLRFEIQEGVLKLIGSSAAARAAAQ